LEIEFHEVAKIFPMMDADQFADLKEDIHTNGLREPIWLHEGKVIDGRNRYLACRETKSELAFRNWGGVGSLVAFVGAIHG